MTPEQFCYWLQGFSELNPGVTPSPEQWQAIRDHLGLVFHKLTPVMPVIRPSVPASPPYRTDTGTTMGPLFQPPQITC